MAKTEVLAIDDWALAKLTADNRRDLLEIIEDRNALRSTTATSELPVEKWHDLIADAILDRLVHRAYKSELKGESLRKKRKSLAQSEHQDS